MNKFKFLTIFGIFVLFLTGCAPSQSVVAFEPYKATASQQNSGFEVYVSAVQDNRKNKSTIATITDGRGSVKEYVVLQNDLATYFSDSLKRELAARGANVNGMGGVVVEVFINEFEANMSGYGSDNTKGKIKITLKIQKGDQNIIKNISNNETKFELIRTGGAFKPFLTDIINDAVKRTALAILNS
jgi:putative lipoprotein